MCVDPLRAPNGREIERSVQCPARECQLTRETARIGAKIASRMSAPHIQRCDRNDRRPARRQQDSAVACEWPKPGPAARAIIEACGNRGKQQPHGPKPQRLIRTVEEDVEFGPVDWPVESQL